METSTLTCSPSWTWCRRSTKIRPSAILCTLSSSRSFCWKTKIRTRIWMWPKWQQQRWKVSAGKKNRKRANKSSKVRLLMQHWSLSNLHGLFLCIRFPSFFRKLRWQRTLNPKKDDDPQHHDVAILVTRQNICSNSGCATLGKAERERNEKSNLRIAQTEKWNHRLIAFFTAFRRNR